MTRVHAAWMAVASLILVISLVASCANTAEPNRSRAQCYWLSNEGAGWVGRPDLPDAQACFEMDSCAGGRGLPGGGCYKWTASADASPWTALGFIPEAMAGPDSAADETPKPACYVQSDGTWRLTHEHREATCFKRDACSGGLGEETGQCFKWAMNEAAPALAWSPTLTSPKLAADIPPPRDLYHGLYEMTSDCPEQGCAYRAVRYRADTPLFARQDTRARVVATVPTGECVQQTGKDALLSAPTRGVVLETYGEFVAGDVIYLTNYDGEGSATVWRRDEYLGLESDDAVVRWDRRPADPREGYWVEVKRANGQFGWAHRPDSQERGCEIGR